ncbi:hypothetical protein EK904_006256 [Melospiza melodia maxima]|nr:hypothetical protein EK904_006256 [Melospiza melodia maxima]
MVGLRKSGKQFAYELEEIRKCGMKNFRNIQVDEANLLTWQGLIVPDNPPYDKGAFRIEINFPAEYPFKPPKITFKTKIYHPNIDEKGQVCLPVISAENWKPATKTDQVIQSLIALVNDPQPEHPLRADLAEEYSKDRKKFCKNAEEFTKKYGEKRPSSGKHAQNNIATNPGEFQKSGTKRYQSDKLSFEFKIIILETLILNSRTKSDSTAVLSERFPSECVRSICVCGRALELFPAPARLPGRA